MTTATEKKEVPAANVIAALAAVMRDLPGIGKGEKSAQGYSYRGIEQITAQVQPLLAKHGVVFVPRVLEITTTEVTVNGKPWTDERLRVEYTVYGPGGVEDHIKVGPLVGIGRDNSDKGANKAMSQAYKYTLVQTLCIGDAKDDGDQATHEADSRGARPPAGVDAQTGEVTGPRGPAPRSVAPPPPRPRMVDAAKQVKAGDPIGEDAFNRLKARKSALSGSAQSQFQGDLEALGLLGFSANSTKADAEQVEALLTAAEGQAASGGG